MPPIPRASYHNARQNSTLALDNSLRRRRALHSATIRAIQGTGAQLYAITAVPADSVIAVQISRDSASPVIVAEQRWSLHDALSLTLPRTPGTGFWLTAVVEQGNEMSLGALGAVRECGTVQCSCSYSLSTKKTFYTLEFFVQVKPPPPCHNL